MNIFKETAKFIASILLALFGFLFCFAALFYGMSGYLWTPLALIALAGITLHCITDMYPA